MFYDFLFNRTHFDIMALEMVKWGKYKLFLSSSLIY